MIVRIKQLKGRLQTIGLTHDMYANDYEDASYFLVRVSNHLRRKNRMLTIEFELI